jgi:hypothetical protein
MIPKNPKPRLDPHIKQLAIFAYARQVTPPCPHILAALAEIDLAYPNLPFRDFVAALRVLALYEERETGGHA